MKSKTLFISAFLFLSMLLSAQTEVKGIVTFKTIKKNADKITTDTIVETGKYTMVTVFNKIDSKLITISDSSGYYFFFLDEDIANYTHVQFYNDYGVYEVFPIKELKQPFHDVVLVKDETIPVIKEVEISAQDVAIERLNKMKEKKKEKKKEKDPEVDTSSEVDFDIE